MRQRTRLLLHVLAILVVLCLGIWQLFYKYLPSKTKHGESITVPHVEGMHLSELEVFLGERQLMFKVGSDSGYSLEHPPLTVLKQFPLPNRKVKEDRKIHVILNARQAPLTPMPSLVDGSLKNAQILLKSYQLIIGDIRYVPDLAQKAILEQQFQGKAIAPGTLLPKGSSIDLVVGDGLGQRSFAMPSVLEMNEEEAKTVLIGSGLLIRGTYYDAQGKLLVTHINHQGDTLILGERSIAKGLVFKQKPHPKTLVKIGNSVDIWVVQTR